MPGNSVTTATFVVNASYVIKVAEKPCPVEEKEPPETLEAPVGTDPPF
jgi:hypothetical protein